MFFEEVTDFCEYGLISLIVLAIVLRPEVLEHFSWYITDRTSAYCILYFRRRIRIGISLQWVCSTATGVPLMAYVLIIGAWHCYMTDRMSAL